MEQDSSQSLLPVVLTAIITAVVIGGGVYVWQMSQIVEPVAEINETSIASTQVIEYNCEQSGGAFSNDLCSCPTEQGEKLRYDSDTGYCMSSFGIPGGELGDTAKKLHELEMLKNQ